jgi:tetraacyldisaccharide 4'-kinase
MNRAAMIALAPLSGVYGLAMKTRRALYRTGIFATHELGAPVISVGNLTAGGTGKTPLVEWVARQLARQNRRVCLLTRGYRREDEKARVVLSDGKQILSTPELGGDEPFLLAERLMHEAAVISDADRVSAAQWAINNLRSDCFVLDDGFQNLRIARDLDLLTIDATKPWGSGWLLPAGTLREPLTELSRADCVVITRTGDEHQVAELKRQIARFTEKPVFTSRMAVSEIRPARTSPTHGLQPTAEEIKQTPVAAFCAIGNPQAFFSDLRAHGFGLVYTKAFRDHHPYKQSDIDRLLSESITKGAKALLTTAKDEVKLRALSFGLSCYVYDVSIEIAEDFELNEMIDEALGRKPAN